MTSTGFMIASAILVCIGFVILFVEKATEHPWLLQRRDDILVGIAMTFIIVGVVVGFISGIVCIYELAELRS